MTQETKSKPKECIYCEKLFDCTFKKDKEENCLFFKERKKKYGRTENY